MTGRHRSEEASPRTGLSRSRLLLRGIAGLGVLAVPLGVVFVPRMADSPPPPRADGTVNIAMDQPVNEFAGNRELGAGVDGLEHGEIDHVWTPPNIKAMRSAGFGPISYRLRTELGVKAWHWNPEGTWSEPGRRQGYWTSSSEPREDYGVSYGYRLPRRGNTIDQANNDGYSRLDDDDRDTFWKSNPYLDPHFTGERADVDPQWVMVEFPEARPVDSLRIAWGSPYAKRVTVQYWTGPDPHLPLQGGTWRNFPVATHEGTGGTQTVRVSATPKPVQFVRLLLADGSRTGPRHSDDVRDRLGFAIRELSVGHEGPDGFVDLVRHDASQKQTVMWTSSTDPWHRARDLDKDYEHASFERVFASGLTNGQPLMLPVPVLYGTPEDAAALIRYLRRRSFPVDRVEMGEEPDGQMVQPEHYGALYRQVAKAMKEVDPSLQFGGPGYQTVLPDWTHWPDAKGVRSWTGRFVSYLKSRGAMDDFDFFSFEWYPFDDVCGDPAAALAQHPALLADLISRQEKAGLPPEVPKVITEYGYSSFSGKVEVELPGAMLNAETAALFLTLGGDTSYYYGLEPNWVFQEDEGKKCNTSGNLMLLQFYDEWQTRPVAAYHGARLVTQRWVQPGGGRHVVYRATGDLRNPRGEALVTAYAVRRPDGRLAVLLFNKDPKRALTVRLVQNRKGTARPLRGDLRLDQYSSKQYVWHPGGEEDSGGHAAPNNPPARTTVDEDARATVTLPPSSISVVQTEG